MKYLSFHHSSFALRYFLCNWQGHSVIHPCFPSVMTHVLAKLCGFLHFNVKYRWYILVLVCVQLLNIPTWEFETSLILVLGWRLQFGLLEMSICTNAGQLLEIRTDLNAYRVILSIHNCDSKQSKNWFWYIVMFILIIFTTIKPWVHCCFFLNTTGSLRFLK